MTATVSKPEEQKSPLYTLAVANRILIKTISAKNNKALNFIILNDTFHAIPYDRAVLVRWGTSPKILGVSGQFQTGKRSDLLQKWQEAVGSLENPDNAQIVEENSFKSGYDGWQDLQKDIPTVILWEPLYKSGRNGIGLWMERWKGGPHGDGFQKEQLDIMHTCLAPGFTEAIARDGDPFKHVAFLKFLKNYWKAILTLLFLASLLIKVPLRVVAPSEVVPQKPIIVAAPIEGIIEEVLVKPGQFVKKDTVLVEYDKRVFEQELKTAQKDVQIAEEELNRSLTLGLRDQKSLSEVSELQLKLEKAKIHLNLVEVQVGKLTLKAPEAGIVIMQNPEEWRGKPVRVGEKIVTLGNPDSTEVKVWIPESDNLPIDMNEPINVYLNIAPEKALQAKLRFISNESVLSDTQIPSFTAEAEWVDKDMSAPRLGLKGTAVLFGDRVTLLYYFMRKPISSFRKITGL